jgi:ubiquinone/menaquinone biosynthesis C-methylase UbiE
VRLARRRPSGRASGGRFLTYPQARRVYDRIGRFQDVQALVERPAITDLVMHADFEHAEAVFELGYGTGALAQRLLERHLPGGGRYVGIDVSPHMYELARRRLACFADRTELRLSDGSLHFPFADNAFDRFLATYVFDLLAPDDISVVLGEAQRLLAPNGRLCLTSLTPGASGAARLVSRVWRTLWELCPELVGGCRPLRLTDHLVPDVWTLRHHAFVARLGFSFEIVVAALPGFRS